MCKIGLPGRLLEPLNAAAHAVCCAVSEISGRFNLDNVHVGCCASTCVHVIYAESEVQKYHSSVS